MNKLDFGEFAEVWVATSALCGRDPSEAEVEMAFVVLSMFDLVDIRRALVAHSRNPESGQYSPKPADIVRFIRGDSASNAVMAWSKVQRAINYVGPYSDVVFDDPITHAVLRDMGGWIQLCATPTDHDLGFRQNEFVKLYRGYALKGSLGNYPSVLTGIENAQNTMQGYDNKPPKLIGDPERAKLVWKNGGDGKMQITDASELVSNVIKKISSESKQDRSLDKIEDYDNG